MSFELLFSLADANGVTLYIELDTEGIRSSSEMNFSREDVDEIKNALNNRLEADEDHDEEGGGDGVYLIDTKNYYVRFGTHMCIFELRGHCTSTFRIPTGIVYNQLVPQLDKLDN